MQHRLWGAFVLPILLTACAGLEDAPIVAPLTVEFTWQGTAKCFDPKSPPFLVSQVPAGTKTLRFAMVDLDAPSYPHGGGDVIYSGRAEIQRGAFIYKGPCPPSGQHSYQWTVMALDAQEKTVLGRGTATMPFPPE